MRIRDANPTLSRCFLFLLGLCLFVAAGCSRRANGNLLRGREPSVWTHAHRPERATDGVSAIAGDSWNSHLACVIGAGGGLEWDLGRVEAIGAAWLEGDNNDQYAVLGSSDAKVWTTIWEAPEVNRPGMQSREVANLSASARYVRLEPRGGDGAYSIAEFVLLAPGTPFPVLNEQRGQIDEQVAQSEQVSAFLTWIAPAFVAAFAFWRRRQATWPASFGDWLREPALWLCALLCGVIAYTALIYSARYHHNTIDDAYISFQYSKNWASGEGVVFNHGERVEGYTNFLWVALLAPLWPLVGHDAVAFAHAASVVAWLLACTSMTCLFLVGRRVLIRTWPLAVTLLLVAFDDAFTSYVVFALENHLLMACMLAGLALSIHRVERWEVWLGSSFALVMMTRPDGALWVGTYFLAEAPALVRATANERRVLARSLCLVALAFLVPYGLYFGWRFSYYGYLLPNTFYLKVGDSLAAIPRGLEYVRTFLSERLYTPLFALLALLLVERAWVRWLLLHALLHTAYVVYVGGDFYAGHRFLLSLVPTSALLAAAVLDAALERAPRKASEHALVGLGLALCLAVRWETLLTGPGHVEMRTWGDVVDGNVRSMRWLGELARPRGSIIAGDIGGAGFFGNVDVHDIFGVIDPRIAHRQVDNLGTGKPGHEKVASTEELMARHPSYAKLGFTAYQDPPPGFYVYNDVPPGLHFEGVLVRDDLDVCEPLDGLSMHMDPSELGAWSREGNAFPEGFNAARRPNIRGARGALVDSFEARLGDRATGRLVSPEFPLRGERLRLLVGGGRDPLRLKASLLVDGAVVVSFTGTNFDVVGRREWNIASLRGKLARIEIVDDVPGSWGHILVDEIEQCARAREIAGKI